MAQDTPEDLIHDLFAGVLWGGHPLARTVLGQPESVSNMTRQGLHEFFQQGYVPSRVVVAAAGNVDHQALEAMLAPLQSWSPPTQLAPFPAGRRPPPTLLPRLLVCPKRLEQAHLVLGGYGLPVNSDFRYALALLNIVLGGNMSSRLFQEIREKRGLAYSIYSFADGNIDSGCFGVYAGVGHESVNEVRDLIGAVIADIHAGGITEEELRGAQEFARAGIVLAEESMESRMIRLAKNELTLGRYVSVQEVETALDGVRRQDLMDLVTALFSTPLSGVILGPVRADDCGPDATLLPDDEWRDDSSPAGQDEEDEETDHGA